MESNLVTLVRDLQRRRSRRRRGLAVAEGIRLVEEALAAGIPVRGAVFAPSVERTPRGSALIAALADHAIPVVDVPEREFAGLSDTRTPQGVLAVVELPRSRLEDIAPAPRAPALVVDAVQDPGNVGTLLRTASALGASGAVLLAGSADLANPKVVRSAMGALFHFPVAVADTAAFVSWADRNAVAIWTTGAEGTGLARLAVPDRLAVVVGNEGGGVRPEIGAAAAHRVAIPLARGAESLNVAVAAGILFYEVTRAT